LDVYSYGIFITLVVVISHHVTVVINTRNFGLYLAAWALFSISLLPFTLWLANILPISKSFKNTYTVILSNPQMWLMAFVTSFFVMLPLYINKRWMQVITYPQFYKV